MLRYLILISYRYFILNEYDVAVKLIDCDITNNNIDNKDNIDFIHFLLNLHPSFDVNNYCDWYPKCLSKIVKDSNCNK